MFGYNSGKEVVGNRHKFKSPATTIQQRDYFCNFYSNFFKNNNSSPIKNPSKKKLGLKNKEKNITELLAACDFVGGENVMRQRKMCKAANESDLLVLHIHYTRFPHELVEHGEGPFFWPPSFALSLSKAEFLGHWPSVGRRCYTLRSSRKRETKLAGLCAAAGRKHSNSPSIIIIREETEPPTVVAQVKAGTLELLRRLEPDVNRLSRRHFPYLSNWRRRGSP